MPDPDEREAGAPDDPFRFSPTGNDNGEDDLEDAPTRPLRLDRLHL